MVVDCLEDTRGLLVDAASRSKGSRSTKSRRRRRRTSAEPTKRKTEVEPPEHWAVGTPPPGIFTDEDDGSLSSLSNAKLDSIDEEASIAMEEMLQLHGF